jgi:hypothetical protein
MWARPRKDCHFLSVCCLFLSDSSGIIPIEHQSGASILGITPHTGSFRYLADVLLSILFTPKGSWPCRAKKTFDSVRVVRWEGIHIWTEVKNRVSRQNH